MKVLGLNYLGNSQSLLIQLYPGSEPATILRGKTLYLNKEMGKGELEYYKMYAGLGLVVVPANASNEVVVENKVESKVEKQVAPTPSIKKGKRKSEDKSTKSDEVVTTLPTPTPTPNTDEKVSSEKKEVRSVVEPVVPVELSTPIVDNKVEEISDAELKDFLDCTFNDDGLTNFAINDLELNIEGLSRKAAITKIVGNYRDRVVKLYKESK